MSCYGQPANMHEAPCLNLAMPSLSLLPLLRGVVLSIWKGGAFFKQKPTNAEAAPQPLPNIGLLLSEPLCTCPNNPGPHTRQLGAALMPQNPQKLFKLVSSKPTYPSPPVPSRRNYNKSLAHSSSSPAATWLALASPGAPDSATVVWSEPSSWEQRVTHYLFNVSYLMTCWLYHTLNFLLTHYILKHIFFELSGF